MNSRILQGRTWHVRHAPQRHAFAYRMQWLCIDVDELPQLSKHLRGFAYNRRSLFSIHDRDYASGPLSPRERVRVRADATNDVLSRTNIESSVAPHPGPLPEGEGENSIRAKVLALLAREGISTDISRIELITLPKFLGYAFNPVSFFRCLSPTGEFVALIAQVRNTFGEMHHYVLRPTKQDADSTYFHCSKSFYVSPFNKVDGEYDVRWTQANDECVIEIDLRRNKQLVFSAGISAQSVPLTTRRLLGFPLLIVTVMPKIFWQAIQLHLRKKLPFIAKPAPSSPATVPARPTDWINRLRTAIVRRLARNEQQTLILQMPKEHLP